MVKRLRSRTMPRGSPRLLTVVALLLAGCATTASSDPVADLAGVNFFAQMGVDLAAMDQTPGGVYYRDVRAGDGRPVTIGREVQLLYVAWLPDGTQVDANIARDSPLRFQVGTPQVIRGWNQGLLGMAPGGQRLLVVPSSMGYGSSGTNRIPPNTTLVFLVELLAVR